MSQKEKGGDNPFSKTAQLGIDDDRVKSFQLN